MAEQEGLSKDEVRRAQSFESDDPKRAAALRFAHDVIESRGKPSDDSFEEVREVDYTDEQVMEMISNVALTQFSNYMNDSIQTEVDIPVVEPTSSR